MRPWEETLEKKQIEQQKAVRRRVHLIRTVRPVRSSGWTKRKSVVVLVRARPTTAVLSGEQARDVNDVGCWGGKREGESRMLRWNE